MSRKYWTLVSIMGLVVVTLVMAGFFVSQQRAASASSQTMPNEQIAVGGAYAWSYAAKYVCGFQSPISNTQGFGEPVVKPGNYATDINIHNPQYKQTPLRKKFLVLVQGDQVFREPQQVEPRRIITMTLGPDMATMDDCNGLWATIFPGAVPPSPMPLLIGYLVILSPVDLDVDVVYTAAVPGDLTKPGAGIAEDVERVTGKRVFVPAGALP
jgi:hypothetical protein